MNATSRNGQSDLSGAHVLQTPSPATVVADLAETVAAILQALDGQVTLTIAPAGGRPIVLARQSSDSLTGALAAAFFSGPEREVMLAIAGETLAGKMVANRLNQPLNTDLRLLLANMVSRGVLRSSTGKGYQVADHRFLELAKGVPS